MLTAEENDLLCRVEGDAPMGQLMRRHWVPAAACRRRSRSPTARRCGCACSARIWWCSATATGALGVLGRTLPAPQRLARARAQRGMRAALPLSRLEDGRGRQRARDGVGAGRERLRREGQAQGLSDAGGGRLRLGLYGRRRATMPEFEPPALAPTPDAKVSIVKIDMPCNWAQILEGADRLRAFARACIPPTCGRRASTRAKATDTHWLRPSTDKAPRLQVQRTNYGFRYAAIRRPISNANTHDYVRMTVYVAPFTALIPPNNSYNVATVIVPKDDTSSDFHFIAWSDDRRRHRPGGLAQVLRARRSASTSTANTGDHAPEAQQQLPAGSPGHEARRLHRHPRHPQPGHRDVGDHGPDRRPHQRAARRQRHRGGAVPPPDDRRRTRRFRPAACRSASASRTSRRPSSAPIRASCPRATTGARSARPTRRSGLSRASRKTRPSARWRGRRARRAGCHICQSGARPTGPAFGRPDDRLRREPRNDSRLKSRESRMRIHHAP